jgi:hypothetical protein
MKYLIHAVPTRLHYVEGYLIPLMLQQGIPLSHIDVYVDSYHEGNLKSTLKSFSQLPEEGITCHLQDDVIVARDIDEKLEEQYLSPSPPTIQCGFKSIYDDHNIQCAYTEPKDMWYSFQCIVIPNKLAHEFVDWVQQKENDNDGKFFLQIANNMFDDYLFKCFMIDKHPGADVYLHNANLVDHIDYIIGGSTLSKRDCAMRAFNFKDQDLVEKLERTYR